MFTSSTFNRRFAITAGIICSLVVSFTFPEAFAYSSHNFNILSHPGAPFANVPKSPRIGDESFSLTHQKSGSFRLIAQRSSANDPSSSGPSSDDISNFLTGLIVILLLPLFWAPTRKAVGLLNVLVGTILTITGIGAIFGIPMIFIGGVCLFL
jgi:hypothetical protein